MITRPISQRARKVIEVFRLWFDTNGVEGAIRKRQLGGVALNKSSGISWRVAVTLTIVAAVSCCWKLPLAHLRSRTGARCKPKSRACHAGKSSRGPPEPRPAGRSFASVLAHIAVVNRINGRSDQVINQPLPIFDVTSWKIRPASYDGLATICHQPLPGFSDIVHVFEHASRRTGLNVQVGSYRKGIISG
jgi:hypothetical protein